MSTRVRCASCTAVLVYATFPKTRPEHRRTCRLCRVVNIITREWDPATDRLRVLVRLDK